MKTSKLTPYLFLAPALAIFIIFTAYPLGRALYMSFFDYPFLEPENVKFVGLENYKKVLTDDAVLSVTHSAEKGIQITGALWNTFIFVLFFTPFYVIIPIFIAVSLHNISRCISFFRTCIYVPEIISFAVASVIWLLIYNSKYGIANQVIGMIPKFASSVAWLFGFSEVGNGGLNWLGEPYLALFSIAMVCFWNGSAFNVLIYLVGLSKIDQSLYESASVDGASTWQQFRHITLPQLMPTVGLVTLLSLIGSFKLFVQPWIMTPGVEHTKSYIIYLYEKAFRDQDFQFGYASALAYSMTLVLLTVSFFTEKIGKEKD